LFGPNDSGLWLSTLFLTDFRFFEWNVIYDGWFLRSDFGLLSARKSGSDAPVGAIIYFLLCLEKKLDLVDRFDVL